METHEQARHEPPEHRHEHHEHHPQRRCPYCDSSAIRRSHRTGVLEKVVLLLVLHRPFHCKSCDRRYYAFSLGRRTVSRLTAVLLLTFVVGGAVFSILTGQLWTLLWRMAQALALLFGGQPS